MKRRTIVVLGVVAAMAIATGASAAIAGYVFDDVPEEHLFAESIAWAKDNNIVRGYGNGDFGPEDYMTRGQLTAVLHRYHSFFAPRDGADGAPGDQGDQGPVGPIGPQGDQGTAGPQGDQGATGPQGDQGTVGPKGDKGDKGAKGDTGAQGPKGDQGEKGDTGATGPQGPEGPQGVKGDTGAQGEKGDQGDVGPQGPQGEKGETGDKGDTGDTGPQGPAGGLNDVYTNTADFSGNGTATASCDSGDLVLGGGWDGPFLITGSFPNGAGDGWSVEHLGANSADGTVFARCADTN